MHGLAQNEFGRLLSTLVAIRDCTGVSICGHMRTAQDDSHHWFSTDAFIKHAREAMGAKTPVELSALLAKYMQEERELFDKRTAEYMQQANVGKPATSQSAASAAIDKLRRPSAE